ncbi:MAG: peptidylprolyl isomerase [Candidatus Competibacteraceae bacterium]|nr:peptidylprolyl isomerase [Candidatus Competibacteraceae bacterium]
MTTLRFLLIGMLFSLLAVSVGHADNADQRILLSAGDIVVTGQDLRQELLLLSEPERTKTLAAPDQLKKFLNQIYQGKRMIAEAERLGLDQTPLGQAHLVAARRQALSAVLREHVRQQVEPTDFTALAREHYAVRRDEFQLPERFKAAHILKKVQCDCERDEQRRRIEQLRVRLQAGEDFAALAKAESEDTGSAAKGGDLGDWIKREDVVAPFAEALTKLNPGEVSDVVETQFGFHLIKLLDRQPARLQSFEEVQPSIEQHLRKTYVQEQLRKHALSYLPGADAKYDETAMEAFSRGQ